VEEIMQAMIQATQVPNLPASDPVLEYMMGASERICATMKGDFLPFVQHLLPFILQRVKFDPKVYDVADGDDYEEKEDESVALVQEGGKAKMLVMSTAGLEELKNALDCVHTFVSKLGKLYLPFVMQTAQALQPVFEFSMREDIRAKSFDTWCALCEACREGGEMQMLGQLAQEFLKRVLPKLEQSEEIVLDVEALKTCAEGIRHCLTEAGPGILSGEQVKHICQLALTNLEKSIQRREASNGQKQAKKSAEDEEPEDDDDDDEEESLRIACIWLVASLMQHHADLFAQEALQLCMSVVQVLLPPTVNPEDRLLALLLVGNMLKHLGPRVTALWPKFLPQIVADLANPSDGIRQPACWCVSFAAQNPAFAPLAAETAKGLADMVTQTRTRAKKKSEKSTQACADNALSALIEILAHPREAVAGAEAQLWGVWVRGLPCQVDEAEGVRNHKMLVELVQSERPEVVGEGGANFPHIVSTLVDIYQSEMVDDDTSKAIGQLFLKLGQTRLEQLGTQMKEKQQKKMLRIHREAQVVGA
jgi:hypothetical protein